MNDPASETVGERVRASYGEAFNALANRYSPNNTEGRWRGVIRPYIRRHPWRAAVLAGTSALAIGISLYEWGAALTAAQMIAIGGLVLTREAAKFKEHRHILATISLACMATVVQQAFMAAATGEPGAYIPGAIMVAHAAATLAAFATIPEERTALRRGLVWGGGTMGAAAAAYLSYKSGQGTGFIPAVTTLANSALFNIKDSKTPRARLGYLWTNVAHFVYWATQPVASWAPMAAEAMLFGTHVTTMAEHDIPVAERQTGRKFGTWESLSVYFKDVIGRGIKAEEVGVTRFEQGWKRSDDLFYQRIGRAVFGS